MKKNKVGRPRKIIKRQYKPLPLMPSDIVPSPENIEAFTKRSKEWGITTGLNHFKTDGLDGVNEEFKSKPTEKVSMIKDNTLLNVELDLINKRKEELETTLDEIRKLQRKTETLTLQIKWLETNLERWMESK